MSDSELSEASHTPVPPDDELEQSLRREVVQAAKANNDFTLRQIREASEKSLGLPVGFYKGHESWNAKSKEIVRDQIVRLLMQSNSLHLTVSRTASLPPLTLPWWKSRSLLPKPKTTTEAN